MIISSEIRRCKKCGASYEHCELDDGLYDDYCPKHREEMLKEPETDVMGR